MPTPARDVQIEIPGMASVSGLLQLPPRAAACVALAHGAGAGMRHAFMAQVADGLAERDVGTLRYQFPFSEHASKRPDRPAVAHATVRAAVSAARQLAPGLALFAGGKSFGARMTSQAQAEAALPDVRGLLFLGFPLHPAGQPSDLRAEHLARVRIPMLFVQGTRDRLADMDLLVPLMRRLGPLARLATVDAADHAFHLPARSARTDAQALAEALDLLVGWIAERRPAGGAASA